MSSRTAVALCPLCCTSRALREVTQEEDTDRAPARLEVKSTPAQSTSGKEIDALVTNELKPKAEKSNAVEEKIAVEETNVITVIPVTVDKAAHEPVADEPSPRDPSRPEEKSVVVSFTPPFRSVVLWKNPTGIHLYPDSLTVASIDGDALALGMATGMTIKKIGGEIASRSMFDKAASELQSEDVSPMVRLTCMSGDTQKTVVFTHRPVGITYSTTMPLTLTEVFGRAEALGLEKGMIVAALSDVDLKVLAYEEAAKLLKAGVTALPSVSPVKIIFDTNDGAKVVLLTQMPLGLTFDDGSSRPRSGMGAGARSVLVITDATGHGAKVGIQAGWALNSIDGNSIVGLAYTAAFSTLKQATKRLPQRPPCLDLELEFGDPRDVTFTRGPSGIRADSGLDAMCDPTRGPSVEAAVKAGWNLSALDGKPLAAVDNASAFASFHNATRELP